MVTDRFVPQVGCCLPVSPKEHASGKGPHTHWGGARSNAASAVVRKNASVLVTLKAVSEPQHNSVIRLRLGARLANILPGSPAD